MKRLLVVILVAAGLWAGYWWIGASGVKSGFAAWLDARRAEGWVADSAAITVQGFPNRFDTTFTDIRLAAMGVLLLHMKIEMGAAVWRQFPQLNSTC